MKRSLIIAVIAVFAGISIGYLGGARGCKAHHAQPGVHAADADQGRPMYYRCPMHPWVTNDKPSTCPICGMDLTPVYEGADSAAAGIHVDPLTARNMGVATEQVTRRDIMREVRVAAAIQPDERRVHAVTAKVMGYAEQLAVNSTGQKVLAGDVLLYLYSPDLVSAQEEYIRALQGKDSALAATARQRLLSWDVPETFAATLAKSGASSRRVPLTSPVSGIVAEKMVVQGQSVMPGMGLYRIVDLSRVWVVGEVYQNDLPFVQTGQQAAVAVDFLPSEQFSGTVSFISPEMDPVSRTVKIRVELANTGTMALKPGMTARLTIVSKAAANTLAVPEQAVLHTGRRDAVIVSLGNSYFTPRDVVLGPSAGGYVQVVTGLKEYEHVVTSAQFLIDAESSLRDAVRAGEHMQPGDTLHQHLPEKSPANAAAAVSRKTVAQKTCPIMGGPVNKSLYVDYRGKRIYVCCEMCIPEVKANPEKALQQLLQKGEAAVNIPAASQKKQ